MDLSDVSDISAASFDFTQRAARYNAIHGGQPSTPYIGNLVTHNHLLQQGELSLPCTVNDGERNNAWVCSPATTYGSYVIEEIERCLPAPLAWPLAALCRGYRRVLQAAAIDRVVTLNNWMLSTNLYPALTQPAALQGLLQQARQRWPQHALWFRSLNLRHNRAWIEALRAQGFHLLPSRQVYLFHDVGQAHHANLQRDLKLLHTTALTQVPSAAFTAQDLARAEVLYGYLYLDKYSRLNPHYTAAFLQRWHAAGLLELHGWRDAAGQLQAVLGTFRQGRTITAPIVGYNTALPQTLGLYRLLMAQVFHIARRDGLDINLSAGAAHFKRLRGGHAEIEYSAVLDHHLPASRRAALRSLRALTTHIGVPLMKRFEL